MRFSGFFKVFFILSKSSKTTSKGINLMFFHTKNALKSTSTAMSIGMVKGFSFLVPCTKKIYQFDPKCHPNIFP